MILAGNPLGIIDKMKEKKTGRGVGERCFIFLELATSSEGRIPLDNVPSTYTKKILLVVLHIWANTHNYSLYVTKEVDKLKNFHLEAWCLTLSPSPSSGKAYTNPNPKSIQITNYLPCNLS
jgi:hypothetical protein